MPCYHPKSALQPLPLLWRVCFSLPVKFLNTCALSLAYHDRADTWVLGLVVVFGLFCFLKEVFPSWWLRASIYLGSSDGSNCSAIIMQAALCWCILHMFWATCFHCIQPLGCPDQTAFNNWVSSLKAFSLVGWEPSCLDHIRVQSRDNLICHQN